MCRARARVVNNSVNTYVNSIRQRSSGTAYRSSGRAGGLDARHVVRYEDWECTSPLWEEENSIFLHWVELVLLQVPPDGREGIITSTSGWFPRRLKCGTLSRRRMACPLSELLFFLFSFFVFDSRFVFAFLFLSCVPFPMISDPGSRILSTVRCCTSNVRM